MSPALHVNLLSFRHVRHVNSSNKQSCDLAIPKLAGDGLNETHWIRNAHIIAHAVIRPAPPEGLVGSTDMPWHMQAYLQLQPVLVD